MEGAVASYRLFKLDEKHNIQDPSYAAIYETKAEAMAAATQLALECHAVEVRQGKVFVTRIGKPAVIRRVPPVKV